MGKKNTGLKIYAIRYGVGSNIMLKPTTEVKHKYICTGQSRALGLPWGIGRDGKHESPYTKATFELRPGPHPEGITLKVSRWADSIAFLAPTPIDGAICDTCVVDPKKMDSEALETLLKTLPLDPSDSIPMHLVFLHTEWRKSSVKKNEMNTNER